MCVTTRAECFKAALSILTQANNDYVDDDPAFGNLVAEAQVYATLAGVSDLVEAQFQALSRDD